MKSTLLVTASAALAALVISSATAGAQEEPAEPAAPARRSAPAPMPSRSNLKKLYKIFKGEPTAAQVQKWALKFHKLSPGRVNALQRDARLKGLIPELEGSVDNMVGNSYINTRDGLFPILPSPSQNPNPNNYKERTNQSSDQFTWRVRAVWSLDRLVFNSEMLDAMSLTSLQENLVREVTGLYYSRRRLLASLLLTPPRDELELFYELTRLEELTSTIDALTGNKFAEKAFDPTKNL